MADTWETPGYPLIPGIKRTSVITGGTPGNYNTQTTVQLPQSQLAAIMARSQGTVAGPQSQGFDWLSPKGISAVGTGFQGVGSLANAFIGFKNYQLAKKQLAFQEDAFNRNFAMQQQAYDDSVAQYDNAQRERAAFAQATHRDPTKSDIRSLRNVQLTA